MAGRQWGKQALDTALLTAGLWADLNFSEDPEMPPFDLDLEQLQQARTSPSPSQVSA